MIDKTHEYTRRFIFVAIIFLFFANSTTAFAETSTYRSATWIDTDGNSQYTITGCQISNDGLFCSRASNDQYSNLYFGSFGNLSSFGIPSNATITKLHIKITGKNTIGQYIGISTGKNNYQTQCQFPGDLWTVFLGNINSVKEFHTAASDNRLTNCITKENIDQENLTFRLNYSAQVGILWSADIDNFEIAFDYTVPPTPTNIPPATPTPTATPIPAPEPFLDLPFDYKKQDKTFEDVALDPYSWFDHKYPLQNYCCLPPVLIYTGKLANDEYYRSHSGYDYAVDIKLGTPVLAAAPGKAKFEPESKTKGGGNIIKIDHGNGYQTWYEHLSLINIITSKEGEEIKVVKGQKIGEVGMTGNTKGPHIHLSVFKDINNNGNFADDYPYGLVDPLGWEGDYPDPWTTYGTGGAQSYNLFLERAAPKKQVIPTEGGTLTTEGDKVKITVPSNTSTNDFTLTFKNGPFESFPSNGKVYKSIVPSFFLNAKNLLGDTITQFYAPIQIVYKYSQFELFNVKQTTLLLHFFNEQTQKWEPLPSAVDTENKTVTAETTHFSHFALMGELQDTIPPTTKLITFGEKGQANWYRSDVTIELQGKDNSDGVGLEYTLYSLDGTDWQIYKEPIIIRAEGEYTIEYQSIDKAGNEEERKTTTFRIDKTTPEAEIGYSLSSFDTVILGKDSLSSATVTISDSSLHPKYTIIDQAGNTLVINTDKLKLGKQVTLMIKNFQYNNKPISLDKNVFFTLVVTDKIDIIKQLDQYYSLRDDKKIFTSYLLTRNSTKIYSKNSGSKNYITEEKPGLILLQLYTQNGTLKYRY